MTEYRIEERILSADEVGLRTAIDHIKAQYRSLLGWNFVGNASCDAEIHIANKFQRAERAIVQNQFGKARTNTGITAKLVTDLATARQYSEDLFQEFVEELESVEFERYYGIRCEIATARSLLIKGFGFQHPDPPDFIFQFRGTELKIECTSAHMTDSDEYLQKICNTINSKSAKPYADGSTILSFDLTNILHNVVGDGNHPAFSSLKNRVLRDAEIFDWSYGTILLYFYIRNSDSERYERIYLRCDTKYLDSDLKQFLNEYHPIEDNQVTEFDVPGEF